MAKVYKMIELYGTSEKSFEDAIRNAVAKAAKTVKNIRWFEVEEFRGNVMDNSVNEFQVKIKVAFRVEE
ncbi:dodecin [candidate division KSB1 bacterium]